MLMKQVELILLKPISIKDLKRIDKLTNIIQLLLSSHQLICLIVIIIINMR